MICACMDVSVRELSTARAAMFMKFCKSLHKFQ